MSDKTGIGWTEATWNPVTGCSKVSQGCKNCYALRDWPRLANNPKTIYFGRQFTDVAIHKERLQQPLRWTKPRLIFVNSMSDLFHESVPDEFIDQVFAVMALSEKHIFQVLTKRPERMCQYLNNPNRRHLIGDFGILKWPLPNVWLGVSVEDQQTADQRIPILLETPAAVRWVSAEPLLEPVDLGDAVNHLDWLVIGGESGKDARPFDGEWAASLLDQCEGKVPVFVKQMGAHFRYQGERKYLDHRAGADMKEWPSQLQVQEWPKK